MENLIDSLTKREKEILDLVSLGCNHEEIASALFITKGTVKSHMRNILSRYSGNRTQLIIDYQESKKSDEIELLKKQHQNQLKKIEQLLKQRYQTIDDLNYINHVFQQSDT